MKEFTLDCNEFYDSLVVFTKEIDSDPYLLFHGTSMSYFESICENGLDSSYNSLFSKNTVLEIVNFFDKIGWTGYSAKGYPVLKPFSLDFDYANRSKKPIFLGELPHRSLLFATNDFYGGETCRALKACLEDLATLESNSEDLQTLAIDREQITTFLKDFTELFQQIKQQEADNSCGVVLAIKIPNSKYSQMKYHKTMGVLIDFVPPEWIIASCIVPSDFQFESTSIYLKNTQLLDEKKDKKLGVMDYFFPDHISLEDWKKTYEYARFKSILNPPRKDE